MPCVANSMAHTNKYVYYSERDEQLEQNQYMPLILGDVRRI